MLFHGNNRYGNAIDCCVCSTLLVFFMILLHYALNIVSYVASNGR